MRKLKDLIDIRGAKTGPGTDWELEHCDLDDPNTYLYNQGLLQLEYDYCLIDLGHYGGAGKDGLFSIKVITPELDGEYTAERWDRRYAGIPCQDADDMIAQLQRAIDVYPKLRNKEQFERDIEWDKRTKIHDAMLNANKKDEKKI